MKDELLLLNHEDESLVYASSLPLLMQKPVALGSWRPRCIAPLGGGFCGPRKPFTGPTRDPFSDRDNHVDGDKKVEILEDKSSVSLVFSTLDDKNEKVLKDVMQQGWLFVGELYDSCMNSNSTNSTMVTDASLKVLSPVLEQIAPTKGKKKLFRVAGVLHKAGTSFSTELGVEVKARKALCACCMQRSMDCHCRIPFGWGLRATAPQVPQ
ncbi:unnamed protein product [Peronospora farinosa]|uniref:Uncharacterized protein n=1 Tax=Peronospora farinosa TaxID=134698 RepID=A0ABN8C7E8_9STRA|nr:unnamed protein product [Peronospora farinosa]